MFVRRITVGSALVAMAQATEILLLDDAGPHIRPGAEWTKAQGNCAQAGHGGGFHHNNGIHNEESFATWNFTIAKDGCYWVEEFHPDTSGCEFSLSSKVPIHIHFCKGLHTAGLVDQTQRAGQWNKLVRLPFYTTHSAAIKISPDGMPFKAEGVWAADAFRLTWTSEDCHDEEAESDQAIAPQDEAQVPVHKVQSEQEAKLPLLQARVDNADTEILGSTLEPTPQCPATASKTFHHDALQKNRVAQATYHFDPPNDGCYLIEEFHPELEQCKASANTKVHINFCKGLKAAGTLDQTATAGQWTYLGALPFYAGHPGDVTLSNEGTAPGTLTVFDQVRFTFSGKSCSMVDSHPRQAEIRMTVDFKNVANRRSEFGNALKTKLAMLAEVPEKALRLTGLRSGSIIAELLVMPSAVDDPLTVPFSARSTMEKLSDAVANNAPELCALTGASLEGCKVEIKDLGVAMPSIWPVQKQRPQPQEETPTEPAENYSLVAIIAASAGVGALFAVSLLAMYLRKMKKEASAKTLESTKAAESEVAAASMEEGKAVDGKQSTEDEFDNNSTLAPSSDKHSEPSLNGDIEGDSTVDLAVLKALSEQEI